MKRGEAQKGEGGPKTKQGNPQKKMKESKRYKGAGGNEDRGEETSRDAKRR